jgi:hypothetical protein
VALKTNAGKAYHIHIAALEMYEKYILRRAANAEIDMNRQERAELWCRCMDIATDEWEDYHPDQCRGYMEDDETCRADDDS